MSEASLGIQLRTSLKIEIRLCAVSPRGAGILGWTEVAGGTWHPSVSEVAGGTCKQSYSCENVV